MQEKLNLDQAPPLHKTSVINSADINILVGCEESQAVTIELRKLGFNAFSCDLLPCSGGYPEWHYQQDIFEVIKLKEWHLGIFFSSLH